MGRKGSAVMVTRFDTKLSPRCSRPCEKLYSKKYMTSENPNCNHDPGQFKPIINRNRCEGKADCVAVCPYQVFTMGTLPPKQRKNLSLMGTVKGCVHKWHQAFATNAKACNSCGFCVTACPEKAITLSRF